MSIDRDINLIIANADSNSRFNRGKAYEHVIFDKLKKARLLHSSCLHPAGDNPAEPDAVFIYRGQAFNLEIKLDELHVEFGELALSYDIKKNKWELAGQDTEIGRAKRDFLKTVRAEQFINAEWGGSGPPMKFLYHDEKHFSQALKQHDLETFQKKFLPVPLSGIEAFYAAKSTYYLQVGKKGFYYMRDDAAGIGAPKFMPRRVALKLRLKTNDAAKAHRYSFVAALVAEDIKPSIFDIDKSLDFLRPEPKKEPSKR